MLICRKPRIFDVDLYGLGVLVIIAILTNFALLDVLKAKTAEEQKQYESLSEQNASQHQELSRLQELANTRRSLVNRLSRTTDILKSNKGISHVIRQLGSLTAKYSISLDDITPGPTTCEEHFCCTPVALRMRGSFPELHTFIQTLTQQMGFLRIVLLQVSRTDGDPGNCNITLDIHVFSRIY